MMFTRMTNREHPTMESSTTLASWRNITARYQCWLPRVMLLTGFVLSMDARSQESPPAQDATIVSEATDVAAEAPAAAATEEPTPVEAAEAPSEAGADEPTAESPEALEAEAPAAKPSAPWYRGSFETEFDSVYSRRDSDFDVSQYLRLDVDPPKYPRLHLRASLWLHQDLSDDSNKSSVLRDINDASSSDVQARLLYLYADVDDVLGDNSVIRIGRQRIQEGAAYNRIDGLYIKKRLNQFEWYAFAGARASVYRDTSSDLVVGGGAAYVPTNKTRIALDTYYAEESRYGVSKRRTSLLRGYSRPIADEINDSKVTLSFWHNFGPNTRAFARIGMLGSNLDELTLSLNGYIPRLDLLYDIDYRQLFNTVGDTTADLSPFYQVLGQYREQQTLYLGLHRPITKKITLSLEGELRNGKNDDFYSGNRDYQRVGTVLYVEDFYKGFDLSTSVEYWNVSNGEGTWTLTGEISKSWKQVDWRTGVDFVRYKDRLVEYDQAYALFDATVVALLPNVYPGFSYLTQANATRVVDTRENVYRLFTDLSWTFREDQEIYGKFSFEEDDSPDSPYWRARMGYRLRF